jgi:IclR family pca regulon transcriptional regulator
MEESNRMFVQSLERGLDVIRSFSEESPRQSLSEVARRTGYSRASCRRLLFTLETLGYVGVDGREFFLQPRILDIGYSFLTSLPFRDIVEPFIQDLSDKVRESVSVSVLDGSDIVFVSRVAASRIMTLSLSVGSRLPAYCTSTGRVLLAAMPVPDQKRLLGSRPLVALTKFTLHRESDILTELEKVARRGWALNDQELEVGLRAVAAPIRDSTGRTVAAINISTPVGRTNLKELREELVPQLLATTQRVNSILAKR